MSVCRCLGYDCCAADEPDYVKDVIEFHETYGVPLGEVDFDNEEGMKLRLDLIYEEYDELLKAWDARDKVDFLDALTDMLYVIVGTSVALGWDQDEAWRRVHKSNMSKLDDEGNPVVRYDGKILKGPNFKAPELDDLV